MSTLIPPGVNLDDDRGPQLIESVVACCVLSGLAVAGRLASRKIKNSNFMASDYLVAAGLVGSWVISGIAIDDAARLGLGKHVEVVPLKHVEIILKNATRTTIFYALALTLIKISVLLFYREIFVGKKFVLLTYIIGAFVLAWFIIYEFVACLNCGHFKVTWNLALDPPTECIYIRAVTIWQSLSNIVADVAILCLPLGEVWHLQTSLRLKVAVACMFLLGGFVTIVSIIRCIIIFRLHFSDITWDLFGIYVWTCVEANIAVVSACLPLLRPLVQKISPFAFIKRIFGIQTSKGAMPDSRPLSHTIGRFIQRFPNYPPEAMSGWHTNETRCEHDPKSMVDEFELGGVVEPHDGIAVQRSFSAC